MTCRWQVRAAELTAAFSPQRKCKNVRFKSHLRNQTKQKQPIGLFFVLLAVKKRDLNGLGSE